ncbi:hypothetical protein ACHQM5_024073 [Ranunculus cassubicifolius]
MEDHRESETNPITTIAVVKLDNDDVLQEPKVLVSGNDFYVYPRIDLSGERLAWVEWSHPNMHWDKAELWVGYIDDDGEIKRRVCVAGGDSTIRESPTEPKWSPKGELFFVTDRHDGYWNIYKWVEHENIVVPVYPMDAEFSRPLWVTGISSYGFIKNSENNLLVCSYRHKGKSYLGILDEMRPSLSFSVLDVPFSDISNIVCGSNCLYLEGASATLPLSIAKVVLDVGNSKVIDSSIIWSSSPESTKYKSYFSLPEFIEFPTKVEGQNAYAYFYPPSNTDYQASQQERPPLLLRSHGGPTDEARGRLDLNIQYWTSRGWAFVDVNYGGSSGYGREFRERLLEHWGIVDVNDCCSCAQFLVETGKVDGERLCITGGSAGGYTTLSSLAFKQTFKAGSSLYGAYFHRSPINFVDQFSCPVILFQGLDDKIVQPNQARKMYTALKQKGLPVAVVEYEGEGHGFHKAENLKFTLEQEMVFFARTVGHFKVADHIIPIKIDNLD